MRSRRNTNALHVVGVGCSVASIALAGPLRHDTGVAVAIGTVALLGLRSLPETDRPRELDLVVGSVVDGGMRQGQFIKSCFAVALLTSGLLQELQGPGTGVPTLLLGAALGSSALANEFEIRELERRISRRTRPSAVGDYPSESSHG